MDREERQYLQRKLRSLEYQIGYIRQRLNDEQQLSLWSLIKEL